MFKYIWLLLCMATFVSCEEEEGTMPGSDSELSVILYQYAVNQNDGDDYDPDLDVHIRAAVNNVVTEAYYLAEKTNVKKQYVEANGADAYTKKVLDEGEKLDIAGGIAELFLRNLIGDNTITVVVKDNNGTLSVKETAFYGIIWNDVCNGKIIAPLLDGSLNFTQSPSTFALQRRDDQPHSYRIKNVYGFNRHILLTKGKETYNDGEQDYFGKLNQNYKIMRMPSSPTGFSYGSYGPISLSDAGDANAALYRIYEDNSIYILAAPKVEAGNLVNPDFFQFIPAE